jgi:hypothetical protein
MQNNTTASPDSSARLKVGFPETHFPTCSRTSGATLSELLGKKTAGCAHFIHRSKLSILGSLRAPPRFWRSSREGFLFTYHSTSVQERSTFFGIPLAVPLRSAAITSYAHTTVASRRHVYLLYRQTKNIRILSKTRFPSASRGLCATQSTFPRRKYLISRFPHSFL